MPHLNLVGVHRLRAVWLLLLALVAGTTGCAKTPLTVTAHLAKEGYAIWYPPESGIEPGQIWLYDGSLRAKFADRPANMPVSVPRPANVDIEGLNDATATMKTTFTELTISKAGPFASELYAGSVRRGTFRVATPDAVSMDLGNPLLGNASAKYGPGYAKAVEMVRSDTPGLLLIAAVVRVPSMTFTLECDDPYKLIGRLPRIRDMVHARVDAKVLNASFVEVTLTPVDGPLVIGLSPVRGERLSMTTDAARDALAHDLEFAQRQSYALNAPVPAIVAPAEKAVISNTDSPAEVVTKYQQAIGQLQHPTSAPSTGPSSGGGSWRTSSPETPGKK